MRLTAPHYFRLPMEGGLDGAATWDELRATSPAFAVPVDRRHWELQADARPELAARASVVLDVVHRLGARSVASYGVGSALLERHLMGRVEHLVCGDFTPAATAEVARLAPELDVRVHDLLVDPPFDADLHLFHRVDTELTDEQWAAVLEGFRAPVLFAFTELLTVRSLVRSAVVRLRGGRRAGWFRTEDAFRAVVPARFSVERLEVADLPGFLLRPRTLA